MPPLQGLKEFGGAVSLRSLDEVKFMIHREQKPVRGHLLELPESNSATEPLTIDGSLLQSGS